jgi:hypothetical protein
MIREAIIAPQTEGKGRSFTAMCLASVEADLLWSGGQTDTDEQRPIWAMFAGSEQEMRPFVANLKTGRKCELSRSGYYSRKTDKMTFLRSAGYSVTWQRETEGSVATVFLPDLFQMDPGMVDPSGAAFVVLPTKEWASNQKIDVNPLVQHAKWFVDSYRGVPTLTDDELAEMVPISFLFASYLDRRARCPIPADERFYLQLMLACIREGLASLPSTRSYSQEFGVHNYFKFSCIGTEEIGFARLVAFKAEHSSIERVLAEQVGLFFARGLV